MAVEKEMTERTENTRKKTVWSFIKEHIWFLAAPAVMGIIILIVYALKGIYPFGVRTISYYDMAQSVIPIYYHTFDVLHGDASLFYNWNVSLGTSMGDVFGNYVLFPTNLFFLFVQRENILNAMSIFLILKVALAAFFMSVYSFSKSKNKLLSVSCSLLYSACGFIIQYYTSIYFLDVVLIFPLLMYAYDLLIEKNRKILYIVCLALVYICNPQMLFFVSLYLLLKTGLKICKMNSADRGTVIFRVLICSVCAILCSGISFVPMILQTMKSARYSEDLNHGFFAALQTVFCECQQHKNFMLYGAEFVLPLVVVIVMKKQWKKYLSNIIMIILLLIPILFEGVNLMWHLGTYQMFPMRFGFILTFECLNLLLISYEDIREHSFKFGRYATLASICMVPLVAIVLYRFVKFFHIYGIRDYQIYLAYWVIFLLIAFTFAGIFLSRDKKLIPILVGTMALIQSALGYYGFLGVEMNYTPECESDNTIVFPNYLRSETKDLKRLYDRTKDKDVYLNSNYAFITQTSSASGWMNGSSSEAIKELIRMGHDQFYIRSLDCGGTILTDSFLGYKYTISASNEMNSDLYEKIDEKNLLYRNKYYLPFGTFVNDSLYSDTVGFRHQNQLYHIFSEDEEDLFIEIPIDGESTTLDEETEEYHTIVNAVLPEKGILYIYGSVLSEDIYEIYVNDQVVASPFLYDTDNTIFPTVYRNGFLEAGSFEGEVKIEFVGLEDSLKDSRYIRIGYMPFSKFNTFIDNKNEEYSIESFVVTNNKLEMEIDANKSGEFVLPLAYSENWKVQINGDEVESFGEINDAFLAFNILKGKAQITLTYVQKGLTLGIILSIIGIGFSSLVVIFDFHGNKYINKVLEIAFWIVMALFLLYIYINPLSSNIYVMIKEHITIKDIMTFY